MKLNIGEKIRELRRNRDMTQEELAEQLGVSCQSVSRWETELCYPDVEMIPTIAAFFCVSVDHLMGLDESHTAAQVQTVLDNFQQAISRGTIDRCIEIAREGLRLHPGNFAIMNKLMYALFVAGDETGNIPDWKENMARYDAEITRLGEHIAKHCPDPAIRLEATSRLAFNHCEMGRKAQGRAVYETLPGLDIIREEQIIWALEDAEKEPNARRLIRRSFELLQSGIWQLVESGALTDAAQESAIRRMLQIDGIMLGDNAGPDNGQMCIHFARTLARQEKTEAALEQLRLAAAQALAFDRRPEQGESESLLLGKRKWRRSDYETADNRPVAQVMRELWLKHRDFDALRNTEAFRTIEAMLTDGE